MNVLAYIFSLFGEKKCLGCKKSGHFFCLECSNKIQIYESYCYLCKKHSNNFSVHEECYKQFPLKRVVVLTRYRQNDVKKLLRSAKYYGKLGAYSDIISHNRDFYEKVLGNEAEGILVPIPMHPFKKWKRGFNQAEHIARNLSDILILRVEKRLLRKRKSTKPQAHLTKEERKNNLAGVFIARKSTLDKNIPIYLVDDVISTGTTLLEVAKELYKTGFTDVNAIVIASD